MGNDCCAVIIYGIDEINDNIVIDEDFLYSNNISLFAKEICKYRGYSLSYGIKINNCIPTDKEKLIVDKFYNKLISKYNLNYNKPTVHAACTGEFGYDGNIILEEDE